MPLSTHYYVLSLGVATNTLCEAFRDILIDIENQGFPVTSSLRSTATADESRLQELARTVDRCLGHYHDLEPLKVVVVGDDAMQAAFTAVTVHGDAIVARMVGDYEVTDTRDLGRMVWPAVKLAMSGVVDAAMRDLAAQAEAGRAAGGIETAARLAHSGVRGTLLVEDGYRLRGSIAGVGRSSIVSPEVDVRSADDDAVDAVIEKLLEKGNKVVFVPDGLLGAWDRIVLLPSPDEGP